MPEALPVPDDLVSLVHAADAAERAVTELCAAHPEPWAEWPEELRAELERLRRDLANAHAAVGQHVVVEKARQQGCRHQTVLEARRLVRETAAT